MRGSRLTQEEWRQLRLAGALSYSIRHKRQPTPGPLASHQARSCSCTSPRLPRQPPASSLARDSAVGAQRTPPAGLQVCYFKAGEAGSRQPWESRTCQVMNDAHTAEGNWLHEVQEGGWVQGKEPEGEVNKRRRERARDVSSQEASHIRPRGPHARTRRHQLAAVCQAAITAALRLSSAMSRNPLYIKTDIFIQTVARLAQARRSAACCRASSERASGQAGKHAPARR